MARDSVTDKELTLKKTARRRLVGAITLVILMLIVLPFVLKDRVVEPAHDDVEITVVNQQANREPILELPDEDVELEVEAAAPAANAAAPAANAAAPAANAATQTTPAVETPAAHIEEVPVTPPAPNKPAKAVPAQVAVAETATAKPAPVVEPKVEPKVAAAKSKEEPNSSDKSSGKFYVQFGVFSDPNNLENLQGKLKQAGFEAATDKVDAAGNKLRLRSRTYATRNEAAAALKKLEAAGFSGIVAKS